MTEMLPLRVTDLTEWVYCPRVVFFHRRIPVDFRPTFKMRRGKEEEERIERLESRRTVGRFGLVQARRRFHVRLFSERWNLSGKLDMLLEAEDRFVPVDFKFSRPARRDTHRIQLAAYALLLEEEYGRPVEEGFIHFLPADEVVAVPLTEGVKSRVLELMEEIRGAVGEGVLPCPTPFRNRCVDCEFRNFCGDVS